MCKYFLHIPRVKEHLHDFMRSPDDFDEKSFSEVCENILVQLRECCISVHLY